jgi:hypothetical protein
MKPTKSNFGILCLVMAGLIFKCPNLQAGTVTVNPTADSSNILVIAKDDTVIFTASSSGNDDYVDISDSTFQNGTPTFTPSAGEGDDSLATVTFSSAAAGQSGGNKCKILVNSSANGTTCSTDKELDFEVDVPKITISRFVSLNTCNDFQSTITITIIGVTDLSEIRFQQWATSTMQLTDVNYNGWDGGMSSPVPYTMPIADSHDTHLSNYFTKSTDESTPRTIEFCAVWYNTIQMFDYVTLTSDSTKLVAQLNWGYDKGDDNNVISAPVLPSPYTNGALMKVLVPTGSPPCTPEFSNPFGGL